VIKFILDRLSDTLKYELRNNIKNPSCNQSVVTNHRLSFNYDFDWNKPDILHREGNKKKREIAEMFFIKKFKKYNNSINMQMDTDNLNLIYDRLITKTLQIQEYIKTFFLISVFCSMLLNADV